MKCTKCSNQVRPVVAVDLDGTLGEYHNEFRIFAEKYWNRPMPMHWQGQGDFETYLGMSKIEHRQAKLAYRQGGFKRFQPAYGGAGPFMRQLKNLGIEVWICTTRPWQRLDNIDPDTRFWLDRNNIPYEGVVFGDDKYNQLFNTVQLDRVLAVVEDLPEQFDLALKLGFAPIMKYQTHNETNERLPGFRSYSEIFEMIKGKNDQWIKENS